LQGEGIALEPMPDAPGQGGRARFFPTTGGILKTMARDANYAYLTVEGIDACVEALQELAESGTESPFQGCFIEMSACAGSCVGGPLIVRQQRQPVRGFLAVHRYARDVDDAVPPVDDLSQNLVYLGAAEPHPGEEEIRKILRQMGKNGPEDELNCGSCGYNTCREKAVAVYQGKANYAMCLPFLKEKAESFSDNIISNTPNGILVLNESLEVQQINRSALQMMNIAGANLVMGSPVVRILDPTPFLEALENKRGVRERKVYLAEYAKYVEQTILYDRSYHILICLMRDVTAEEAAREKREALNRRTIETADQVVEKQMRIVQEIASLLGETTAETKIALTRLKESLADE
ncbi:MAG TPA: (Fe-S)-binding protein, partial [Clostridia bacterium]|nr:(Fe-S)-binding protein [Clostridia bacterium]